MLSKPAGLFYQENTNAFCMLTVQMNKCLIQQTTDWHASNSRQKQKFTLTSSQTYTIQSHYSLIILKLQDIFQAWSVNRPKTTKTFFSNQTQSHPLLLLWWYLYQQKHKVDSSISLCFCFNLGFDNMQLRNQYFYCLLNQQKMYKPN